MVLLFSPHKGALQDNPSQITCVETIKYTTRNAEAKLKVAQIILQVLAEVVMLLARNRCGIRAAKVHAACGPRPAFWYLHAYTTRSWKDASCDEIRDLFVTTEGILKRARVLKIGAAEPILAE